MFMNTDMPKIDLVILDVESLERARIGRLLTLGDLKQRAGICDQTLQKARHGRAVGLHTAKRIAKALRAPVRSLIAESPAENVRKAACA